MHELIKKKKSHTVSFGVRSNDWHGELDPGLVKFKLKHVSPGTMLIPANVLGKAAQQVQREKGTTQREKGQGGGDRIYCYNTPTDPILARNVNFIA
ncbi:hypothetical protein X798_03247 [Onchocerca flexuosa]|uniref:Uncharacterized protein n=1 Tax=Onchocerca flexuosa TaxID=387005 RepID=A0A238BXR1_9BILA|nr:hypothetical protein X798_03247 [Onchocerca flexuosa]